MLFWKSFSSAAPLLFPNRLDFIPQLNRLQVQEHPWFQVVNNLGLFDQIHWETKSRGGHVVFCLNIAHPTGKLCPKSFQGTKHSIEASSTSHGSNAFSSSIELTTPLRSSIEFRTNQTKPKYFVHPRGRTIKIVFGSIVS